QRAAGAGRGLSRRPYSRRPPGPVARRGRRLHLGLGARQNVGILMKIAFVFPGQGSQAVGMLDAWAGDRLVQDTVREGDAALDQDLSGLIARGPAQDLNLTANTQPAMLLSAVAMYRAWIAAGGRTPDLVAGHSLGEYSALTAAQSISLADALRTVRVRAQAMQAAVPVGVGG